MNFGGTNLRTILIDQFGRAFSREIWTQYSRQAVRQGFDRLYLLLSFDCDTPEDAQAAEALDAALHQRGIQRSYAVPGTMLEANPAIYKKISAGGAEFLNHGYLPHTQLQEGIYRSTTFYAAMDTQEVVDDIQKGHRITASVTGRDPSGFRAPHFGKIPLQMQSEVIRPVLKDLGEFYSSQTTPLDGMKHGPVWWENNWPEFPLSGSSAAPYSLLDSFSYLESSSGRKVTPRYSVVLDQTIRQLLEWKICGLLNIYVDPSHVIEAAGFMEAMQMICDAGISSLTYSQSLEICSEDPA